MTPAQLAARKRLADDFAFYASKALKIRTKGGEIKPLVLNEAQRYFLQQIEQQLAETGRIRAIILKGRQQGLSTVVGARLIWRTSQQKAKKALVVAHKAESTRALFDMTRRYYDNLPEVLKPEKRYSSRSELVFGKLESSYAVATAGGEGIARGETLQYLHASEMAFWAKISAAENFNGLMKAIPNADGTEAYIESTANGVTGVFAETWRAAVAGENGWLPIFIPWFWQKEYRIKPPKGFERTPQEQELADRFGLDDKQLAWRRREIAQNGLDLFRQEYPCTPDEAFLTTGRPVFNQDKLAVQLRDAPEPIATMELTPAGSEFEEQPRGPLKVYREYDPAETYTIGADVAMGVRGGDYSVAHVLDGSKRQAAVYRAHVHPDYFAVVLNALGRRYNDALVSVESNNHGLLTVNKLSKDLLYPNVYQEVIRDTVLDRETVKLGWSTNVKTKPLAIDLLRAAHRDDDVEVYDRTTLEEMRSYILTEEGKLEAEQGCHDDCVMSLAIAVTTHQEPWLPIPMTDDDYIEVP